jgi:TRAP-type C4-dicarboxylate transport system permease small subunit
MFQTLLMVLMALLVVSVTWQVLSRYLLGAPSHWTEELARFLLVWIGVLGASYAFHMKMHLGIDLLALRLRGRSAFWLELFINTVVAVFAILVMIVGGANLVMMTWELQQLSAGLGLPMAWVYSVVPLSGGLIVWYALDNVVTSWRRDLRGQGEGA